MQPACVSCESPHRSLIAIASTPALPPDRPSSPAPRLADIATTIVPINTRPARYSGRHRATASIKQTADQAAAIDSCSRINRTLGRSAWE